MITFILTGHNHFATGVASAIELIAGNQEAFEAIDFNGNESQEELGSKVLDAIKKYENHEVIICTDLVGGTPFKTACEIKMKNPDFNIEVLSGSNLGMLLEGLMSRSFIENASDLASNLVNTGKDQVIKFEFVKVKEEISDDGI